MSLQQGSLSDDLHRHNGDSEALCVGNICYPCNHSNTDKFCANFNDVASQAHLREGAARLNSQLTTRKSHGSLRKIVFSEDFSAKSCLTLNAK